MIEEEQQPQEPFQPRSAAEIRAQADADYFEWDNRIKEFINSGSDRFTDPTHEEAVRARERAHDTWFNADKIAQEERAQSTPARPPPDESDQPRSNQPGLTRRDLLKYAGLLFLAGIAAGTIYEKLNEDQIPEQHVEVVPEVVPKTDKKKEPTVEESGYLDRINLARKRFGLKLVAHEEILSQAVPEWDDQTKNIENKLKPEDKMYFEAITKLITLIVGEKRANKIIKSVRTDNLGKFFAFSFTDSSLEIPRFPTTNMAEVSSSIIHELGHALDATASPGKFPRSMIFQLQALTMEANVRVFETPQIRQYNNLFWYPGNLIERTLGRQIVKNLSEYRTKNRDINIIINSLEKENEYKINGKPVYNKALCTKLGQQVLPLLQNNTFTLSDEDYTAYNDAVYSSILETFAQIMSFVLWPNDQNEDVSKDSVLREKISEIISTIAGKPIELSSLISQIQSPVKVTPDVAQPTPQTAPQKETSTPKQQLPVDVTPTPVTEDQIQERIFFAQILMARGEEFLPYLSKEIQQIPQLESLKKFSSAYATVIKAYPALEETLYMEFDESFDPKYLDIFQIEEVIKIMDTGFIREILSDIIRNPQKPLSSDKVKLLTSKIEFLTNLINSTDFQTDLKKKSHAKPHERVLGVRSVTEGIVNRREFQEKKSITAGGWPEISGQPKFAKAGIVFSQSPPSLSNLPLAV